VQILFFSVRATRRCDVSKKHIAAVVKNRRDATCKQAVTLILIYCYNGKLKPTAVVVRRSKPSVLLVLATDLARDSCVDYN